MRKHRVLAGLLTASLTTMTGSTAFAQHKAPNTQPTTTEAAKAPTGALVLGTVQVMGKVTADGKPLPAGSYQVRLTADEAKPAAAGSTQPLERWVEFVQKGAVKGREVVSIVPEAEVKTVVKDTPPKPGVAKVQKLKGDDYVRIWINKAGNHYLIHLPAAPAH